jgi:membrane-associated protease RseP (regulator of RpoE activity)
MAKTSGRFFLIAALVCGAFLVAILWSLRHGVVLDAAPGAPGTSAGSAAPQPNSAVAAAAGASAAPSVAAALPAVADSAPEVPASDTQQALPPLEARQLAKITHGMRPNPAGGLLVEATPPGSVVGQLQLQPGDVIVSVDGIPATTPEQFARTYQEQGLPRELTILRNGAELHRH